MSYVRIGKMQIHESMLTAKKEDVLKAYSVVHPDKLANGEKNPKAGKPIHNAENIWKAIQDYKEKQKAKA